MFEACNAFLAVAVSNVHIGVGRSPGSVDLPVFRDQFGVPEIPASSLKGSVKSACIQKLDNRDCFNVYGRDVGSEDFFVSAVSFTDAVLLFYPARIVLGDSVYIGYVTSKLQASRVKQLLDVCMSLRPCGGRSGIWRLASLLDSLLHGGVEVSSEDVFVNDVRVDRLWRVETHAVASLVNGSPIAARLADNGIIYVVEDPLFPEIVDAGLIRVTRVALDYRTKTVREGHLWSEEYVGQGAVFAFSTLYRGNNRVSAGKAGNLNLNLLEDKLRGYLQVGGKETIGRGLLKIVRVA